MSDPITLAQLAATLAATERTLDRLVSSAAADSVRLCVDTHQPLDLGNYPGPIHCLGHPQGHPCVTAMYGRTPDSTVTAEERNDRRPPTRIQDMPDTAPSSSGGETP
jgi:hypothetical protein